MSDLFPITLTEQMREVERELKARAHVYPNLIASKKLAPTKAERQMELMRAVLVTLQNLGRLGCGDA